MDFAVRQATELDIPVLVQILNEANQFKLRHGDDVWGNEDWTKDEVGERLSWASAYLFFIDDEAIGTVSLQWQDEEMWGKQPPNAGYLHRLAVSDDHHGQDVGGKIMNWAVQEVAKKGRKFLRLDCPAENKSLCAYYQKHGFKLIATKQNPMYNQYTAAYFERSV